MVSTTVAVASGVDGAVVNPPTGPVSGGERIIALDVIRGVAVCGILMLNIYGFGFLGSISSFIDQPAAGANWWAWFIVSTFFEGTQRTLFAILFGAGVILLTARMEERGGGLAVADIYYRRSIWLILFGMAHAYLLLWEGDILYFYGIVALFLFPLRTVKPMHLVYLAVAVVGIKMILGIYDAQAQLQKYDQFLAAKAVEDSGAPLTAEQQGHIDTWREMLDNYLITDEVRKKKLEAMHGNYSDIWAFKLEKIVHNHSYGLYRVAFLDAFSMMLLGMALMQWGVLTLRRSTGVYWLMVAFGLGIGWPLSIWESMVLVRANYPLELTFGNGWTGDIGRIGSAIGYLGLLLVVVRSGWLSWLQRRFAALGRMALTHYLLHSVICAVIFYGFGFALFGMTERYELYYVVLGIWVFQLILNPIWLRYFHFGPAEWLWRSLTYMKRQPMWRGARGV